MRKVDWEQSRQRVLRQGLSPSSVELQIHSASISLTFIRSESEFLQMAQASPHATLNEFGRMRVCLGPTLRSFLSGAFVIYGSGMMPYTPWNSPSPRRYRRSRRVGILQTRRPRRCCTPLCPRGAYNVSFFCFFALLGNALVG